MKGVLFLSGGGVEEQSKDIDTEFANALPKNASILFIPLARQKEKLEKTVIWFKNTYSKYGLTNISVMNHESKINENLLNVDAVYISGGNTYRLLKNLTDIGGIDFLRQIHNKKIPIYGGSAGAVLLGKNIDTSKDENIENLSNTDGMNLLRDISIVVHYTPELYLEVKQISSEKNILCIPEDAGVIFEKNILKIVGNTCLLFIDGVERILKKGKHYEL